MRRPTLLAAMLVVFVQLAHGADIVIEKTGKPGIDVSGLNARGGNAAVFKNVLQGDLARSGWFDIAAKGHAEYVVLGDCAESGGDLSATCEVRNGPGTKKYLGKTYRDSSGNARRLAHKVADEIVFALKGVKGIASTRIAMVGKTGSKKDVFLCDADGGNICQLTHDGTIICLCLNWSPDGNAITYTSDASRFSDVYMINLAGNTRRRIMKFPGQNVGADISPDGERIAVVLSKDGNNELYTTDINGGNPIRLTTTRADEAMPGWSPDGRTPRVRVKQVGIAATLCHVGSGGRL